MRRRKKEENENACGGETVNASDGYFSIYEWSKKI